MKTIRNLTLGLAVVVGSVPMFAGQQVDPVHGQASGKRVHSPVTVAPPANNGKGQQGKPGMAVKGMGVPDHATKSKPAQAQPVPGDKGGTSDGAAKGQANE